MRGERCVSAAMCSRDVSEPDRLAYWIRAMDGGVPGDRMADLFIFRGISRREKTHYGARFASSG